MRCLALAQACKTAGMHTSFMSRVDDTILTKRIENAGHRLYPQYGTGSNESDIEVTRARLDHIASQYNGLVWLILDGYHFGPSFHDAVLASGHRLLVIDDRAHLPVYRATILLNQNLDSASLAYHFSGDVMTLFGADYALLRSEFMQWRTWTRSTPKLACKVLVTLGGSDPHNTTLKVMQGLSVVQRSLAIRIVTGSLNPHYYSLVAEAGEWPQRFPKHKIEIVRYVEDMADEMARSELAVTGAGSTAWELAFMQLPSLIIALADNQQGNARELAARGFGLSLGWHESLSSREITSAVEKLIVQQDQRHCMAQLGRVLVNGLGAQRVAGSILQCST